MKKLSLALFAMAAVLAFTPVAMASEDSFDFSFTDGAVSGSGTLYGTYQGSGTWLLDSGSGTFNDGTGSGVINLQANPNYPGSSLDPTFTFGYDDQLTLWNGPSQYLDETGLFFTYGEVDLNLYQGGGGPGTDDPGRFHASHINMVTLLTQAFGVSVDQITVPARLKDSTQSAYYAVDLAIPPGTTKEQYQKMMQNLLTDRFHLAYHRETRDFPGYELVVDKDGPKFKEVAPTPGAEPNPTMRIIMGGTLPAEFPELDGPQTISMSGGGITRT